MEEKRKEVQKEMDDALRKEEHLKEIWKEMGSAAIAFSGGVDSTYLLKSAREVLGERAAAITVSSAFFPKSEQKEAEDFCRQEGISQIILPFDCLEMKDIRSNPENRCYHCKKAIFSRIKETAEENGLSWVTEGTNQDDLTDYRPGLQAIRELGIRSPLLEAGLTKNEIRLLSRKYSLPTWNKPSFACLASRFVYGEEISSEKLNMVERAEEYLKGRGFSQMRVRIHGKMARIEVLPEDFSRLVEQSMRQDVSEVLIQMGFSHVSVDLSGYRTGSMNT
ncbi:MAG: ATP-dependent sacrificial sulfur transferase LarE [Clostridiales bacterium]|nr:ATP-dependent sacrificial sulfur transferase LarE [Clostridiales bacterium]